MHVNIHTCIHTYMHACTAEFPPISGPKADLDVMHSLSHNGAAFPKAAPLYICDTRLPNKPLVFGSLHMWSILQGPEMA